MSKNIWIIGASYGIGEALSFELAKRGNSIALSGRNRKKLEKIKKQLSEEKHLILDLDVSSFSQMKQGIEKIQEEWKQLDSVIFMAGVYTPSSLIKMSQKNIEKTVSINLTGAFYMIQLVLPVLLKQKKGQIAICSSVSAYRGLPKSQPYAATKAALVNLTETLNSEYGNQLDIKLINPGFVKTRLTDKNNFYMPMLLPVNKSAYIIANGLNKSTFEIHFPKTFTIFLKLIKLIPDFLYFKMIRKLGIA